MKKTWQAFIFGTILFFSACEIDSSSPGKDDDPVEYATVNYNISIDYKNLTNSSTLCYTKIRGKDRISTELPSNTGTLREYTGSYDYALDEFMDDDLTLTIDVASPISFSGGYKVIIDIEVGSRSYQTEHTFYAPDHYLSLTYSPD